MQSGTEWNFTDNKYMSKQFLDEVKNIVREYVKNCRVCCKLIHEFSSHIRDSHNVRISENQDLQCCVSHNLNDVHDVSFIRSPTFSVIGNSDRHCGTGTADQPTPDILPDWEIGNIIEHIKSEPIEVNDSDGTEYLFFNTNQDGAGGDPNINSGYCNVNTVYIRDGDGENDLDIESSVTQGEDMHENVPLNGQTRIQPYFCIHCNLNFSDISHLIHHNSLLHANEEVAETQNHHNCQTCGKFFDTSRRLNRHMRSHKDQRPHKCGPCGRLFKSLLWLNKHSSIHTENSHKCDHCTKKFISATNLAEHIKIHTTGIKVFECEPCGEKFNSRKSIQFHNMSVHTGKKPYRCDICNYRFREKYQLNRHRITHNKHHDIRITAKNNLLTDSTISMGDLDIDNVSELSG